MILRLLVILVILSGTVVASDFYEKWTPGQTEHISYEIRTIKPRETVSYQDLTVRRDTENKNILILTQKIDMPSNQTTINSEEKYNIADMRLIDVHNNFKFPPQAKQKMGSDTLSLTATMQGDSLIVKSDSRMVVPGPINFPKGAITTIGTTSLARSFDLEPGKSYKYKFINLIRITGQSFTLASVTDTVMAVVELDTKIGKVQCYKVKNLVKFGFGYTYYTADDRHIPIRIETFTKDDQENPNMIVNLTKYERQDK